METSPGGHLIVDNFCRTTHYSGDIFAAGDVACFPLELEGGEMVNHSHVQNAREMAQFVAQCMADPLYESTANTPSAVQERAASVGNRGQPFQPVPSFYSRVLELHWNFYGIAQGEPVVLDLEHYEERKRFGVFWLRDNRVVGAFLEGGTAEEHEILRDVAVSRPEVRSIKMFRRADLQEFLDNPRFLAPDSLEPGDFAAETHSNIMHEVFHGFEIKPGSSRVKLEHLEPIMKELGADWNKTELAEAYRALDPHGLGVVSYNVFCQWWTN
uniref:monodehydroascorbate reductase (NADH) n=1 Tax=Fibrocapsa japonica TaxID=94617 RepID=A0A7S2UXU9_9STRA